MPERLAHNVHDAAQIAHVGPTKIRAEIKAGRLAARKAGKLILIMSEDLQAWLEALPRVSVAA
jgi:excisionase family DNA binding protein